MTKGFGKSLDWIRLSKGPYPFRRLGRALFWSRPRLYRWFGQLRGHGNCLAEDFDVWIDGYPRSANSFTVESFRLANPGVRVRSHRHLPTFIIHSVTIGKPGIFLVRKPEDAIVSWAIFWNADAGHCLDYYIDYHHALRACAPDLFVASFEMVTTRFTDVIGKFNAHFGTSYSAIAHDGPTLDKTFSKVEESAHREPSGRVNELRVSRPSRERAEIKPIVLERLQKSPSLSRKLEIAREIYSEFAPTSVAGRTPLKKPGHTQPLPALG